MSLYVLLLTIIMAQCKILVKDGKAYLAGFGSATVFDGVLGLMTDVHGNERWWAPELLPDIGGGKNKSGKPTADVDMYSFGSVCLEVCPR